MDFALDDDQRALVALAAGVFDRVGDPRRIAEVENTRDPIDRAAWRSLAGSGLLGLGIPDEFGGIGLGFVETCLVLEQQGRAVVPVPLWATTVLAAAPLVRFGTDAQRDRWLPRLAAGSAIGTAALAESGAGNVLAPSVEATARHGRWGLDGHRAAVAAGQAADVVVVPARVGDTTALFLLEPAATGVTRTPSVTTNREVHSSFVLRDAPAELLTDDPAALQWLNDRAQVGLAALQLGVAEEALHRAAAYLSTREQFGVAVGTFQGPQLRAADAYIDVEAIRCALWQAAWLLDNGRDAAWQVRSAKWWAAEAGQRVVHAVQHLHGGIGADVEYPIHRYFLWGKQLENTLGSASSHLAALGELIAR